MPRLPGSARLCGSPPRCDARGGREQSGRRAVADRSSSPARSPACQAGRKARAAERRATRDSADRRGARRILAKRARRGRIRTSGSRRVAVRRGGRLRLAATRGRACGDPRAARGGRPPASVRAATPEASSKLVPRGCVRFTARKRSGPRRVPLRRRRSPRSPRRADAPRGSRGSSPLRAGRRPRAGRCASRRSSRRR